MKKHDLPSFIGKSFISFTFTQKNYKLKTNSALWMSAAQQNTQALNENF